VLAVSIVLFFWRLVFTHQFEWIWGPDLAQQVLPWFEIQARQFNAGHWPLWDSSFWCGQPLFGQMQPGAAFPLNWILFSLPLDSTGHISRTALEWYFVVIHVIAGLSAFLMSRDLGRSRGAAVIAGLFFALGGYVGHTGWPQMLNGAIWAPLVFLFLFRMMRGERPLMSAMWAGVFQGCAWLSGHHEVPIYTSLASLLLCVWAGLRSGTDRVRWIGGTLLFCVFAAGVGALQVFPGYEYGRLATRFGAPGGFQWNQYVPYAVHATYSMDPAGVVGLILPAVRSDLVVFVGVLALALGLVGAVANWSSEVVRASAVMSICGLLYALGGSNVIQGAMYAVVPQLNRARHPQSAIILFDAGLAVLLAFGVDALPVTALRSRLMKALLIFGAGAFSVLAVMSMAEVLKADPAVGMAPLVALLLAGILWAVSRGLAWTAAVSCIGILLVMELGATLRYYIVDKGEHNRTVFLEQMNSNEDIAGFLKQQPGPFRIQAEETDLPLNWAGKFGLETYTGYLGGVTNNMLSLDLSDPKRQQLMGVRYRIAKERPPLPVVEVFRGASGLRVFRDDAAFPRAWVVHESALIPPAATKSPLANTDNARLKTVALTAAPDPALRPCAGIDDVRYLRRIPAESLLQVTTPCDGILVIAETWFPGWRAAVDGKSAPMRQVDGALQGVWVPGGTHTVEVKYRPLPVIAGACSTGMFILAALVCEFLSRGRGAMSQRTT